MLTAISAEDKVSSGAAAALVPIWLKLVVVVEGDLWPSQTIEPTITTRLKFAINKALRLKDFLVFLTFNLVAFFRF